MVVLVAEKWLLKLIISYSSLKNHGGQRRDGPFRQRRRERWQVIREVEEASKISTGEQPDHNTIPEDAEDFKDSDLKADQQIKYLVEIHRNRNIKAAEEADEQDKINLKEELRVIHKSESYSLALNMDTS